MLSLVGFIRPGIGELLLILLIIAVVFGASKLPKLGSALGEAIKEFRKSVKDEEKQE